MRTTRSVLGNDRGSILPGTIAGSVLNLIVLGIIAAAITGQAFLHLNTSKRSSQISEVALSDAALRSDVAWAGKITAGNPRTLVLESSVDGRCRTATWTVTPKPSGATLERTTSFSDTFTADGGCGSAAGASKETMIESVDPAAAFDYRQEGSVHLATLDVTTGFKTKTERTYRITQAATGLYAAPASATAPGTQVPEGDLR